MTGADGLKQLLKVTEMRFIALGTSKDIVDVRIGSWNCCKVCGNDALKHCGRDFETLG